MNWIQKMRGQLNSWPLIGIVNQLLLRIVLESAIRAPRRRSSRLGLRDGLYG